MNIAELLKICPKGTKLYSPLCGEVEFEEVLPGDCGAGPYTKIIVNYKPEIGVHAIVFYEDGKHILSKDAECLLFPSKDNRDWSTFVPPCPFKPFDKVVVRRGQSVWYAEFFSHYDAENKVYNCIGLEYDECLPYNEETAKLIGTTDDYNG